VNRKLMTNPAKTGVVVTVHRGDDITLEVGQRGGLAGSAVLPRADGQADAAGQAYIVLGDRAARVHGEGASSAGVAVVGGGGIRAAIHGPGDDVVGRVVGVGRALAALRNRGGAVRGVIGEARPGVRVLALFDLDLHSRGIVDLVVQVAIPGRTPLRSALTLSRLQRISQGPAQLTSVAGGCAISAS
jgi:hypothetical protein